MKFPPKFWEIILLFFTFLFFLLFSNRGLVVGDEGYILEAARRFSQGQVPYRDFSLIYTPGIVYLLGCLFIIFGKSILLGRMLMVLVGVLISFLFIRITKQLASFPFYLVPSFLFIFWGIPQLNFPWPTWFCFLLNLCSLLAFLSFFKTKKMARVFLAAFFASLVFLFKQTFGLASIVALISSFILFGWKKPYPKNFLILTGGLALPILVTTIMLTAQNSFSQAFQATFLDLLRFGKEGFMKTGFPFPNFISLDSIGKTGFYWLPPTWFFFFFLSLFLKPKLKSKKILASFIYLLFFYLAGLQPTIDLLHAGLIFPTFFPILAVLIPKTKNLPAKIPYLILIFLIVFLGTYKLLFKNYAGFESPYLYQIKPINVFGQTLYVDSRAITLIKVNAYVRQHTKPGEKIFVYYYGPMIYFLSERDNATRFTAASAGALTPNQQTEVINNLKEVRLVVLQSVLDSSDPTLVYDYLISEFAFAREIGDYQVRKKL